MNGKKKIVIVIKGHRLHRFEAGFPCQAKINQLFSISREYFTLFLYVYIITYVCFSHTMVLWWEMESHSHTVCVSTFICHYKKWLNAFASIEYVRVYFIPLLISNSFNNQHNIAWVFWKSHSSISIFSHHNIMLPNLDLIILAILHASLISFVLLSVIFIILLALLVAFFLALLLLSLFDMHHCSLILYEYLKMVKDDLQLGMVLILVSLINQAVDFVLVSKPWHKRKVDEFEVKAQKYSTSSIHVFKTVQ